MTRAKAPHYNRLSPSQRDEARTLLRRGIVIPWSRMYRNDLAFASDTELRDQHFVAMRSIRAGAPALSEWALMEAYLCELEMEYRADSQAEVDEREAIVVAEDV